MKRGEHDIIRPSWIFDSLRQYKVDQASGAKLDVQGCSYVLPLEPCHIFHAATAKTEIDALKSVDKYGNSYCRDNTVDELRDILNTMPTIHIDRAHAEELRKEIYFDLNIGVFPGWTLSRCVAYIDTPELAEQNNLLDVLGNSLPTSCGQTTSKTPISLRVAEILLDSVGGKICRNFYEREITHVVVASEDKSRVRMIRESLALRMENGGSVPKVVLAGWVEECVKERTWVDEDRFAV